MSGAIELHKEGDFWNAFGADAFAVSKTLGVALTSRRGRPVAMAGFPAHGAAKSFRALMDAGFNLSFKLEGPRA